MAITGGCYLCYYLALILTDALFSKSFQAEKNEIPVLTFTENSPPEKVSLEDFKTGGAVTESGPASIGLGGVSLQNLFVLARQDALQYTKSVSF